MLAKRLAPTGSAKAVLDRVHLATNVEQRHFVQPIEHYEELESFTQSNQLFAEHALALAAGAVRKALDGSGLEPSDVDFLFFTTVTGVAAPALDVLLAAELGFRSDLRRVPSFGLGCVAGASGIARVSDYLVGHPNAVALVISVEICSLTIQWQDRSMANFVGTGIFGDGAGAVLMVGDSHNLAKSGISVLASKSVLYPQTEKMIGWNIGTSGLTLMLEAGVPELIEQNFAKDVDSFLTEQKLNRESIGVWIAHPGGPKILTAFESSLSLPTDALASSWHILRTAGNMSSAAILHVLAEDIAQEAGTRGLLFAFGPGVSAEMILLEWA